MNVYRVVATTHDYFFYIAQELGISILHNVIGNQAIMYAINREIQEIQRNISNTIPNYDSDLPKIKRYATPAKIYNVNIPKSVYNSSNALHTCKISQKLVPITFNSIDEPIIHCMKDIKAAIPKTGTYYRYPPLTTFEFFVISENLAPIIRLGKKMPPVRLYSEQLSYKQCEGTFLASHPVNLMDLPSKTQLISGNIVMQPPTPLFINCRLNGKYLLVKDRRIAIFIALPDIQKYPIIGEVN